MSVIIEKDRIVKLAYRLLDTSGRLLEERTPESPYEYMQGRGQIVSPVERALDGKTVGYIDEVLVSPQEGYGDYHPGLVIDIPRKSFPANVELKTDMKFTTHGENGEPMAVRVIEIRRDVVTVDGNHPLAGLELIFEIKVLDVRIASNDETEIGRPGGPPLAPGSSQIH
jgi:FKBP-type peptidyl-prolyl cis-trans isomerase SlyD